MVASPTEIEVTKSSLSRSRVGVPSSRRLQARSPIFTTSGHPSNLPDLTRTSTQHRPLPPITPRSAGFLACCGLRAVRPIADLSPASDAERQGTPRLKQLGHRACSTTARQCARVGYELWGHRIDLSRYVPDFVVGKVVSRFLTCRCHSDSWSHQPLVGSGAWSPLRAPERIVGLSSAVAPPKWNPSCLKCRPPTSNDTSRSATQWI